MKKYLPLTLIFLLPGLLLNGESLVRFQTDVPGNLFYEKDKITVLMSFRNDGNRRPVTVTTHVWNDQNQEFHKGVMPIPRNNHPKTRDKLGRLVPGFYTYIADLTLQDGQKEREFFKFGVIRKPEGLFSPDDNPFGVDAFLSWRCSSPEAVQKAVKIMKRAGIPWVRDRFSWSHIQPSPGRWNWERYDPFQEIQSDGGLHILQVMHDTAPWASEKKRGPDELRKKFPPEDTMDYYRFIRKTADHYHKSVSAWEVWNEFDIPVFFLGTADEYARIQKAGFLGIKSGNPIAPVLLGSVTLGMGEIVWGGESYFDTEGRRYIEKLFENGAGEYFDIFNVHHYGPVEGVTGKIRECRRLMSRYGYDKPIWLTEMGSTSTSKMGVETAKSEIDQACYLVKAYCLALAEGVEKFFYFSLPSFIEHGKSNWGILEQTPQGWQPKPGLVALSNLLTTLDGMKYYGRYETHLPVEALIFSRGSAGCMILWSRDHKTYKPSVFFRSKQEFPTLRRIFGENATRQEILVGTIPVGPEPLILLNFDIYSLDRNLIRKPQLPAVSETMAFPLSQYGLKHVVVEIRTDIGHVTLGMDRIHGEARICNYSPNSQKGRFSLLLISPEGEAKTIRETAITVPPERFVDIPFDVPLSPRLLRKIAASPGGEIRLTGLFERDDIERKSLPAVRYFPFFPPVEISRPGLLPSESADLLTTVTVRNRTENEADIALSLFPESHYTCSTPTRAVTLPPHGKLVAGFALKPRVLPEGQPGSCRARIVADVDGLPVVRHTFLEMDAVCRTFLPFEIDGQPEGWRHFQPLTLEGRENFVQGMDLLDKGGDLNGRIYLAWDDSSLYLFALVSDREVMNPFREVNPWTGDALELFLDMREGDQLGSPEYGPGVFQIFIVPPDRHHPEPLFQVWQPEGRKFDGVKLASIVKENAYSLEIEIPWTNLTTGDVGPGKAFGFEATIDDIDEGDYCHRQLVWRGGSNNWRDPSLFSRLVLRRHPPVRF